MNNNSITESEIIALHKKYALSEELFDVIYTHCLAVWRIAEQLIVTKEHNLDNELVKAGCLLHDIGTYKLIEPSEGSSVAHVNRGVAGEQILIEEGMSKALCGIVAHHVGHKLTAERIADSLLPLPQRDLSPKTAEERLVNYVSKLHARSDEPQFNSVDAYRTFINNLGVEYAVDDFESLVKEFGDPDLNLLAKEFAHKLA